MQLANKFTSIRFDQVFQPSHACQEIQMSNLIDDYFKIITCKFGE